MRKRDDELDAVESLLSGEEKRTAKGDGGGSLDSLNTVRDHLDRLERHIAKPGDEDLPERYVDPGPQGRKPSPDEAMWRKSGDVYHEAQRRAHEKGGECDGYECDEGPGHEAVLDYYEQQRGKDDPQAKDMRKRHERAKRTAGPGHYKY